MKESGELRGPTSDPSSKGCRSMEEGLGANSRERTCLHGMKEPELERGELQ